MTWFDKSGQRQVKTAVFPDRSPPKKPAPAWIPERTQLTSTLSNWLSSRPGPRPPSAAPPALPAVSPARHSQPPAAKPAPQASASRPPPPLSPTATDRTSAEAMEAKSLSIEQRESMMPRSAFPGPLPPLPHDMLAARGHDSVDFSAAQAAYETKMQAAYQSRLELATAAFELGVEELAKVHAQVLADAQDTIVVLASALARRVIGREITVDPDILLTLAAEGAEALGERDRIIVRLAPFEDEELWQSLWDRLKRRVPRCELVQDPELAAGQCIVESEHGRVDESVDARLDNVLSAILPATPRTAI